MSFYSHDPWRNYTTIVKTVHGVEVKLNPDTGRFAFRIGHRLTERKDLKSVEAEINRLAGRKPQDAMRNSGNSYSGESGYTKVTIVAREPNTRRRFTHDDRYRTADGGIVEGNFYVLDETLMADFSQLAQERAAAHQVFEERWYALKQRLVPFVFQTRPVEQPPEVKPVWQEFGSGDASDATPGAPGVDSGAVSKDGATGGR